LRFQTSLGKKLKRPTISTKKLGLVVSACDPSCARGVNRRIVVWSSLSKNIRPYLKT
jgi:hypothetical protein